MYRMIAGGLFLLYFAVSFPQNFMSNEADLATVESVKLTKAETRKSKKKSRRKSKRVGRAVGYRRGDHFSFNAMLNGRNVKVLVDTGASSVAINKSTARRIGIRLSSGDFVHTANTANGSTKYAVATIKEIRIDGIVVRNVRAAVLKDSSLSSTLLGMSFLKKLRKFQIDGNKLTMVQ